MEDLVSTGVDFVLCNPAGSNTAAAVVEAALVNEAEQKDRKRAEHQARGIDPFNCLGSFGSRRLVFP